MPRKSKKSTEPESPAVAAPEANQSIEVQALAAPAGDSELPVKKPARKPRAKKAAAEALAPEIVMPEPAPTPPDPAEVEAKASAADTFDDAFERNGAAEAAEARGETEAPPAKPMKPKKARKSKAKEAEILTPQPEPQADGDSDDLSIGEEDEEAEDKRQSPPLPAPKLERLQKILAAAGVASRRHAEELITEGRVQVNGKVVTELGSKADAARDHIRVDGKLLHGAERLRYFVLNKPRGYVTTVSDPEGRATVMEFFSKMGERLYPVGRLDYLSEGLLLMTNDGELANQLTRAASGVEKTYLVKVSGQPGEDLIDQLREGIRIDRGKPGEGRVTTSPARIEKVRSGDNPWFEVTLIEGRNRELRKMFEEIGHFVEKIRRVGYGPLVLDQEPGQMRELDEQELKLLRLAAEGKWKPKRLKAAAMLPKEAGRSVDHEGDRKKHGQGWRPPNQDRRPGGRPSPGPGRSAGSFADRGGAARGGAERRQSSFGGQSRGEDRPRAGSRPAQPRGEGSTGFVPRDRGPERPAPRSGPPRDGQRGWQGGAKGGADRGGQRGGFSRPMGTRPFRAKPAFESGGGAAGRPPRPAPQRPEQDNRGFKPRTDRPAAGAGGQRFGDRPARPARFSDAGEGRGFKPRNDRPAAGRPPQGRPPRPFGERTGDSRGPKPFSPRPPRLQIEEDTGGTKPREQRPAAGRPAPRFGERPAQSRPPQRFGERPSRPAGSSFRPERSDNRGQGGGSSRGPSGGGQSRGVSGPRPAGSGRPSGGGRPAPGGKPGFGSGPRGGRPASGPPRGNRPSSGPRGGRPGNNRGR
jgi:23S rRNA pseudouridine2605 synthase